MRGISEEECDDDNDHDDDDDDPNDDGSTDNIDRITIILCLLMLSQSRCNH